jgi:8-oxo-dGTP diphosphatase|uniref:NUDIX domain-containing protein n=1 Tax=Desulfobacca acetoxidans TaxID=60893 RepID=A0A7C5AL97_9BACT
MKRHYPDKPLVGVGAVIFRGEEVLLVRRGQEPQRGSWSLPGGLVELGEGLEAAVKREIREETGLSVEVLGLSAVLDRIYRDPDGRVAYHYVLLDFACDYLSGELKPASDITAARFVNYADLTGFSLPPFTEQVIRRAVKQKQTGAFLPLLEAEPAWKSS